MKITPEYLASLPEWLSNTLKEMEVEELYDTRLGDAREYIGNYDVRVMWNGDAPTLIFFDENQDMNLMVPDESGAVTLYEKCWLSGYSGSYGEPVSNDEIETEISMGFAKNG